MVRSHDKLRWGPVIVAMGISALVISMPTLVAAQPQTDDDVRSLPLDTDQAARARTADDVGGDENPEARLVVRDVVVSNTDPNLTKTDLFSDQEPSIAVNRRSPRQVVITAFSGSWGSPNANAPLWESTNGGNVWTKEFTIPPPPGTDVGPCPCDQVIDYGRRNRLSGTFLTAFPRPFFLFTDVYSGTTTDPASAAEFRWFTINGVAQTTNHIRRNADQPQLLVNRDPVRAEQDNVYVAYDDFGGGPDMRVAVARGSFPPDFTVDNKSGTSTGFINPGHRLAANRRDGTVFSLFQRFVRFGAGTSKNLNYMLNRSTDGGTTWTLNGSTAGIVVANGDSDQPRPKFGTVNALLGGVVHGAVDPRSGDLYYVFADRDAATGNNRLSISRLTTDDSGTIHVASTHFVTAQVQAALPSVAVSREGTVGVLYDTFDGFSPTGFPMFTAHFATSDDRGVSFSDHRLLTFASATKNNGNPRQRVLGDYQQVKAVGSTFYGVFTGNGIGLGRPFANHDPIFFKFGEDDEDSNNDD